MIVTKKFVFIHFAKTGGTFVAKVLEDFFKRYESKKSFWKKASDRLGAITGTAEPEFLVIDSKVPVPFSDKRYSTQAPCFLIPEKDLNKEIVSVVRNPLDHYASIYEFRYWVRYPAVDPEVIRKKFPAYPELDFASFFQMEHELFFPQLTGNRKFKTEIGFLTWYFIRYYFKDPETVLDKFDDEYVNSGAYKADMFPVTFLRTKNINKDIFQLLMRHGYAEDDAKFIIDHERVLPGGRGRSEEQTWRRYYSEELLNKIVYQDRFLFKLFPEFLEEIKAEGFKVEAI